MSTKIPAILILVLALAGCATGPPKGNPELLDFLADNRTTKEEVILKLGQPSGRFDSEKILTYRLGYKARNHGYYLVERESSWGSEPVWANRRFSLVLVFGAQNILRQHSLVEVTQ